MILPPLVFPGEINMPGALITVGKGLQRPSLDPAVAEALSGVTVKPADVGPNHRNPEHVEVQNIWKEGK